MNNKILTEIEANRKIYIFQKAVEEHTKNQCLASAQAVSKAKADLALICMRGGK